MNDLRYLRYVINSILLSGLAEGLKRYFSNSLCAFNVSGPPFFMFVVIQTYRIVKKEIVAIFIWVSHLGKERCCHRRK